MGSNWSRIALLLVLLGGGGFGCQEKEGPGTPAANPPLQTAPPNAAMAPGTPTGTESGAPPVSGAMTGAPPMAGGAGSPTISLAEAAVQAPKLDPSLAPLEKSYLSASEALKKSPTDAAVKKSYVQAAYSFGHGAEYSEKLDNKVKYRAALKLYRDALKVDPTDAASLKEKNQIEDIYRSMPGGIPK